MDAQKQIWPERIAFADACRLIGGNINDAYDADRELVLETVDVSTVWAAEDWYQIGPTSGAEFNANPDPDDAVPPDWTELEAALAAGEDVPPVILERTASGQLVFVDGWHRMKIALHVGRTHLRAYIAEASP